MTRPRLLLSDVVLGWFYGALYWVVVALVSLRTGWVACQQMARDRLWRMAAQWPRCRPLVQSLLRDVGRSHIGTAPSKPTILGVVLVQQLGGPTDLPQLAALITWAAHQGLQAVCLYDPQGWLQHRARELEKRVYAAALAASGTNGSSPAVTFHVGWPPLGDQLATGEQQQQQWGEQPSPVGAGSTAPAAARRRGKSSSAQQSPATQQQQQRRKQLRVVLLSGADAHWPLAQAAFAAAVAGGMPGPAILGSGAVTTGGTSALLGRAGALEGAAAGGSCSCLGRLPQQPSSGSAANVAAHPAGAAAGAGTVGSSGSAGVLPASQQGQQGQQQQGHAAQGSWGGSSASLSHLGAPSEGGSSCGGSCSGRGGPLDEGRLEGAIAAPARLRARLEAAAGPVAAAEPDLVMVFGEALTLAGFPPWAARTCEIFPAGLLCDLSAAGLNHILQRFLGTKQRFGV